MLDLHVTPANEVRFVVAVKAVIRLIICQGGLNNQRLTRAERLGTLMELEELERILVSGREGVAKKLEADLKKVQKLEHYQARLIHKVRFADKATTVGTFSTSTASYRSS